jgi:outer membrane protein assembly factor BamD (BamD/ComL family)
MFGPVEPSMAPAQTEPRRRVSRAAFPTTTLLLAGLLLGGCGSIFGSDKAELVNNDPPNVIYGQAEKMVDEGDFEKAARQYEQVDINHP